MDKKGIILFADDSDTCRDLLRVLAKDYFPDYDIEIYPDGKSVEDRILRKNLDRVSKIILDNEMPGINGSELIRKHAKKRELKDIPIFLCYGGDESIGKQAVKDGAKAYFLKPISFEYISKTINQS